MLGIVVRRVAAATLAALALAAPAAQAAEKPVVTVFAAASLREAFDAAGPAFTRATGYPVRFSFAGSDTLATQIAQGAPADVLVAASAVPMQKITALLDRPRTLAHNRLVVIAPQNDRAVVQLVDLAKPRVKVVLAAPTVPAGAYARRTLAALARDRAYGADFAERVNANVVSEETDVKAVATKIVLGEGDAGIVYVTDVTPAVAVKVRVLRFPPGAAPEAAYPIAAVNAAPNPDGARAFVAFITSAAGRAFLKARGFEE